MHTFRITSDRLRTQTLCSQKSIFSGLQHTVRSTTLVTNYTLPIASSLHCTSDTAARTQHTWYWISQPFWGSLSDRYNFVSGYVMHIIHYQPHARHMTRRHNIRALLHWNTVTIEQKPLYVVTHKTSYVVSTETDNHGTRMWQIKD